MFYYDIFIIQLTRWLVENVKLKKFEFTDPCRDDNNYNYKYKLAYNL